jgi:hypothetical protein
MSVFLSKVRRDPEKEIINKIKQQIREKRTKNTPIKHNWRKEINKEQHEPKLKVCGEHHVLRDLHILYFVVSLLIGRFN